MMPTSSLYRRALGEQFEALPAVLQRFHEMPGGGRARGTLQIARSSGPIRSPLSFLLGLPRSGTDVSVRLVVEIEGHRERWVRHFPSSRLETLQWERNELLMESFGPIVFASRLIVKESCLCYQFRKAWILGIPLPRWLGPFVEGRVEAGADGWLVAVRVNVPIIGELFRYNGWISLE